MTTGIASRSTQPHSTRRRGFLPSSPAPSGHTLKKYSLRFQWSVCEPPMDMIRQALSHMATPLRTWGKAVTVAHCQQMQEANHLLISALSDWLDQMSADETALKQAPSLWRRVRTLFRLACETVILVRSVRGQCGRLECDPTDSFGQLCDQVTDLIRLYRAITVQIS